MPSQGYNSLAYGKLDEVGLIVDVQLVHQAGFVPLYGLRADNQHIRYFPRSMSLCDQLKNLPFPIGQPLVRVFFSTYTGFQLIFFNKGASAQMMFPSLIPLGTISALQLSKQDYTID
ncbi:unnamed protein product [marine sediment metagenome]|uniref:Uncharacterized protein n=1 Tax=marine sediment metagenome TaxID=412755 RepID=X1NZC9_9ZZZZ